MCCSHSILMFIKVPIKCVCTTVMLLCRNDHPVQCSCNFARLHLYYHRCCIILIAICCPGNVFCAVWLFFYFSCVLLWSTFIILDRNSPVSIFMIYWNDLFSPVQCTFHMYYAFVVIYCKIGYFCCLLLLLLH